MERNMRKWVQEMIGEQKKRALPVLSFPAVQLMGCTVRELIGSAQLQAEVLPLPLLPQSTTYSPRRMVRLTSDRDGLPTEG